MDKHKNKTTLSKKKVKAITYTSYFALKKAHISGKVLPEIAGNKIKEIIVLGARRGETCF